LSTTTHFEVGKEFEVKKNGLIQFIIENFHSTFGETTLTLSVCIGRFYRRKSSVSCYISLFYANMCKCSHYFFVFHWNSFEKWKHSTSGLKKKHLKCHKKSKHDDSERIGTLGLSWWTEISWNSKVNLFNCQISSIWRTLDFKNRRW